MSKSKNERRFQIGVNIALIIISLIMITPLILLISASFTGNAEIVKYGYSFIPRKVSLEGYAYIWTEKAQIFWAYGITLLVTAAGTLIAMTITFMYGYAISRPDYPGKKFLSFILFFTMLFNGGLVPTYIWYTRYLHIKNTLAGLIVPNLMFSAFNVILVRSYIQTNIPNALVESAKIDGASEMTIFRKVVMPMAKPIVATIGLFVALAYWNDWMNGLYYITDSKLYSVQQLLNNMIRNVQFLSENASSMASTSNLMASIPQETVRMAIAVVGILPILALFPFIQKYFVKGITAGAVKG